MSFRDKYLRDYSKDPIWTLLSEQYQKYWENYTEEKTDIIPKKIHQIWLGPKPVPELTLKFSEEFKRINPDWEYKLWRDDDIENFNLKNKEAYDKSPNWGSKSDIARYEILYKEGGIYLDTDFIPLKSFNELIYLKFFTGCGWVDEPEVFNGLFGCYPNHPLLKILVDNIKNTKGSFEDIMAATGPYFFSKYFFEYIKKDPDKAVALPTIYFYAFPPAYRYNIRNWSNITEKFVYSYIKPESIVCHLWHTSWQS